MSQFDDAKALQRLRDIFAEHLQGSPERYAEGGPVDTPFVDDGLYSAPNSIFNTPPSDADVNAPAQVYAGGGPVSRRARAIVEALLPKANPEEPVYLRYGAWPENERSKNWMTKEREPGVSVYEIGPTHAPVFPDGENEQAGSDLIGRVMDSRRHKNNAQYEPPYLVQGDQVGTGYDGEPLLRSLRRVGESPEMEYSVPHRPGTFMHSRTRRKFAPFADNYADGGLVDMIGGPTEEDYGAGRFTRTPAERRINRERRIADHVPERSEEWDRYIGRHRGNPLTYGMEALARLEHLYRDRNPGQDVADFLMPHSLQDEYGQSLSTRLGDAAAAVSNWVPGAAALKAGIKPVAGVASQFIVDPLYTLGREGVDYARSKLGFADGGPVEYDSGGRVMRALRTIKNAHGSLQGARAEQAADLTNLERLPTKTIMDLFEPKHSSPLVAMPTDAFEDYAPKIPEIARNLVPYPRWSSAPRSAIRGLATDELTMDNYLDRMAGNFKNAVDSASTPALWLARHPESDMTDVVEHEGRHRMRALNRMGDERGLVQLRPVNEGEMRHPIEERLQILLDKYFPDGGRTIIRPQDSHLYDAAGVGRARVPSPIYEEPFQTGGPVLSRIAKSVLGKPDRVKIPGVGEIDAHPIREFEDVASSFARRYGNEYPIQQYPEFDEARAKKIAEAYELMKHDPLNPQVKRSYEALIDETMDQYRALEGTGAKFEFLKPGEGDPYAPSPSLGYHDLITNGRLKVFPTESGFGTLNDISDNPLLRRVGRVGDLENATANDAFRVVHDALGHFGPGNPFFRHKGEERAWNAHARSFSPEALGAATSETRGQNSWLNFGPYGEKNRTALGADTTFADQKTGLLPEWMYDPETRGYKDGGKVLKAARRFLIDPLRESYPGIYKDPDVLVREAREHLVPDPGKEGPMYRLFGHTRDSLDELSQGERRFDSITPFLGIEHPVRLSGTADISPNVLTRRNAGRISDIIGEALEDPQLRTTRSWYEMSPLYDRMSQIGTGDAAMKKLNNTMAVMSAGSDPRTEINRGFHANWLANEGRLDDFIRYGGTPDHERGSDFPDDLRSLMGHAYHGTAQVPGLLESQFAGRPWPGQGRHKVPTYAAATDPVHPYSARPVADSHFNRILGYPDVAPATTRAGREGVPTGTQYSDIVPWFNKIAEGVDTRPRDAQALLWNVGGPQTGVRYIGPPKLEMIADYMDEVARLRQIDPRKARDQLLSGEIGGAWDHGTKAPFARGGSVDDFDNAYQSQYYAQGGAVSPADEALGYFSMYFS